MDRQNEAILQPILQTYNLCKRFDHLQASKDISLELYPNEIHALIGPNGAGKSTLIKQIAGALKPDSGTVVFDSNDVTRHSTAQRAQLGLARTFQVSALALEDTVLENALLGCHGANTARLSLFRRATRPAVLRDKAMHCIERVGLLEQANMRAAELSHGQRRQLEIAVALTLSPRAFIMDEPMAGMGAQGSAELIEFLDTLKKESPILLVEHDMDAVFALADRISVLVYGKIIASGTLDDIRANEEVRHAYLGDSA